jgi:hypothetical protein
LQRAKSVTYVSGMKCYLCPKNGPEIIGAPDRIRTCDLCLRSYMFIGYLFDFIEVLVAQTP